MQTDKDKFYLGGVEVPYIPGPNDCWSNPYDKYKNAAEKAAAWEKACDELAINQRNETFPVKDFNMADLAFVAGLWRIQDKCHHTITRIRDKDMFLLNKLNRVENTLFTFWNAKEVVFNCYGVIGMDGKNIEPDYIVATYETDDGILSGYGKTLEGARAFLGLLLYDKYKDLIHESICAKKLQNTKQ